MPAYWCWKARGVDLSGLLAPPNAPPEVARRRVRPQDPVLDDHRDHELIERASAALESKEPIELRGVRVENKHRTVGGLLSGEVARRHGAEGLPDDTILVELVGSGGQSFGVGGGCSAGRSLCIVALLVLPRTIRTPGRLSIGRRQHLLCKKNLHSAVGQSPETVKPAPDSHRNPQSSANGRARIARWMNAQLELMNRKFSPVSFPSRRQPRRTIQFRERRARRFKNRGNLHRMRLVLPGLGSARCARK